MRKMIKRITAATLGLVVMLSLTSCKSGLLKKEPGYYEEKILGELTAAADTDGRLHGISEDVVMIDDETAFDPNLIAADHCLLICEDAKEALYAKNAKTRIYPASLTKLMTAVVVLEGVEDLSKRMTITDAIFEGLTSGASLAGLMEGAEYSIEDLLYALLVPSGNDAANALAIYTCGSVSSFVDKMNEKALELGMLNTHFANPHGLHDSNHYTTAYDLYLMTREAAKYPVIRSISSAAKAEITAYRDNGEEKQSFNSTNSFLRQYSELPPQVRIGFSKTGYTSKAGRCLIMDVTDESGKQYIAIVTHVDTYDALYERMYELLNLIP